MFTKITLIRISNKFCAPSICHKIRYRNFHLFLILGLDRYIVKK